MHAADQLLTALTIVLGAAAVTTVICQKIRQPVVLGYILAGLIIGPHVPIPLVADALIVQTLSELGVILLMFALGLEFSLRKLIRVAPTAGLAALIQCGLMVWIGILIGRAFGWTEREGLYTGAIIAISSTTIIAKAFDEEKVEGPLRDLVVGILVVEDLIGIFLIAILTSIASGGGLTMHQLASAGSRLALFLTGFLVIGMFVVPRLVQMVQRLKREETSLVASIGLAFGAALMAHKLGYSVALGAFLGGSLVAESGHDKEIERLIRPVRDMFAAVFFVSVGLLIDPALLVTHWRAVVVLTAAVVAGKFIGVSLGAFLAGHTVQASVRSGMSLAQIGEFSFIIAGLGLALGETRPFLYPVAVSVSALTTLSTPWFIRASRETAVIVERHLPRPLQVFAALYPGWVQQLRHGAAAAQWRQWVWWLALDAGLLVTVIIGTSIFLGRWSRFLTERLGLEIWMATGLVFILASVCALPFGLGMFRMARRLGMELARVVLPTAQPGRVDLAAAPRRVFAAALQLSVATGLCVILLVITQPFLPGLSGIAILILLLGWGLAFWRGAENLQGHVHAGAQLIVEALGKHAHGDREEKAPETTDLIGVQPFLPGIGTPLAVRIKKASYGSGKTLGELASLGLTGITILAIVKRGGASITPTREEQLKVGDVVVFTGPTEAVQHATTFLGSERQAEGRGGIHERI